MQIDIKIRKANYKIENSNNFVYSCYSIDIIGFNEQNDFYKAYHDLAINKSDIIVRVNDILKQLYENYDNHLYLFENKSV